MSNRSSPGDGLYMAMIAALPRHRFGRVVRRMAGWEGNTRLSQAAVAAFARQFKINVEEAEKPLGAYPNIHAFFTRRLKPGLRPVDADPAVVVSPVDGVLSQWGPIIDGVMTQVKGKTFTLTALMGGEEEARPYLGGCYMTIYLSPRHYHRIHSPVEGSVCRLDHIPGDLWPVNGPSVRSVDGLFAVNERVTSFVRTSQGQEVAVIKVGAVGVGHISLAYHSRASNLPNQGRLREEIHPPYAVAKGGELGTFELGSTVILVCPPGFAWRDDLVAGQELKMGEAVGRIKGDETPS